MVPQSCSYIGNEWHLDNRWFEPTNDIEWEGTELLTILSPPTFLYFWCCAKYPPDGLGLAPITTIRSSQQPIVHIEYHVISWVTGERLLAENMRKRHGGQGMGKGQTKCVEAACCLLQFTNIRTYITSQLWTIQWSSLKMTIYAEELSPKNSVMTRPKIMTAFFISSNCFAHEKNIALE